MWLLKAVNDLNASKILTKANCLDVAIYHTQQCAEKALKGYLALKKQRFLKTHDLAALVALCEKFEPRFSTLNVLAEKLTPFSTLFRYPEAELYPKKQTVLSAIRDAEKILHFVETQTKKKK